MRQVTNAVWAQDMPVSDDTMKSLSQCLNGDGEVSSRGTPH